MIVYYIILGSIALVSFVLFTGINISQELKKSYAKVNNSEIKIISLLKEKKNTISDINDLYRNIINVEASDFVNLDTLNLENYKINDLEIKLNKKIDVIKQIKNDYEEINKNKQFREKYNSLKNINDQLKATIKYYDKHADTFNIKSKKFPYNIFFKIKRMERKILFNTNNSKENNYKVNK